MHRCPEVEWVPFIIVKAPEEQDIQIVAASVEVEKDAECHLLHRHPEVEEALRRQGTPPSHHYAEADVTREVPAEEATCDDASKYATVDRAIADRTAGSQRFEHVHYEREVLEKYVSDSRPTSLVAYSPTFLSQDPPARTRIRPAASPEYANIRSRNIPIRMDYRERPRSHVDVSPTVIYNPRFYMAELSSEISPVSFKYYDRNMREIRPAAACELDDRRRPYEKVHIVREQRAVD